MNLKHRRLVQTVSAALLVAYTTLLAYQTLSRGALNNQEVNCFTNNNVLEYVVIIYLCVA